MLLETLTVWSAYAQTMHASLLFLIWLLLLLAWKQNEEKQLRSKGTVNQRQSRLAEKAIFSSLFRRSWSWPMTCPQRYVSMTPRDLLLEALEKVQAALTLRPDTVAWFPFIAQVFDVFALSLASSKSMRHRPEKANGKPQVPSLFTYKSSQSKAEVAAVVETCSFRCCAFRLVLFSSTTTEARVHNIQKQTNYAVYEVHTLKL